MGVMKLNGINNSSYFCDSNVGKESVEKLNMFEIVNWCVVGEF